MEFPDPGRWHAAGEDDCFAQAGAGRLALQRGAFGTVADDQRPHRHATVGEQPGRLEQGADALVRHQGGDHAHHVVLCLDAQVFAQCRGVGQRPSQELFGDGVRHDEHLAGGHSPGHDLVPHGLAERDHEVGLQHGPGLKIAVPLVQLAGRQLAGVRVPGQPGVLPEAADLVDDGYLVSAAQGERDPSVGVVARGVQDGGFDIARKPGGQVQAQVGGLVRAGREDRREQAVVGDAVEDDQPAAVEPSRGHGISAPGDDVRIQARRSLGSDDLVGPDRVPGAGGRQRVGDQVQDAARGASFMIAGRNGRFSTRTARDHGLALGGGLADAGVGAGEDGLLGEEGGAEAAGSAGWGGTEAADPAGWGGVEGLDGVGEAAFAPGQAGGQDRAGTVVVGQRGDGGCCGCRLVGGQGEGGQAAGVGGQRGQRRVALPRAPQRCRASVRAGEAEGTGQRGRHHPPGQHQRADRIAGYVPPRDRGREAEHPRRRARRSDGRHGGGF